MQQCCAKTKELRQAHQKAREANSRFSVAPNACHFYKELHPILGGDPPTTTTQSPVDTSGGLQAAASGVNPKDEVVDEEVELEEDVGQETGTSSGVASQDLFLTSEGSSQSQHSVVPEAGKGELRGIPETVPLSCVNRQCSSGLQAVINIAGGIRNGSYDIGLACGVETMSLRNASNPGDVSSRMMDNSKARDCLIPMGMTSENVAERFGISRKKQDDFALASQQKAARALQMGLFKNEIIPVRTTVKDDQGNQKTITVLQDEGIRPSTTLEGLAKLKPAFKENGSTTAGNSSQVSDGAAAVLLAKRSKAAQLGLPVLGVLKSYAVVGVPPDIMGIGPAYAIPVALEKAGLTVNDIDIYEINEAFASQVVYCVEKLGIPKEKVNPLGGAIALGHPLGCTGARQVVTLLNELKRRGKRAYGVVSMCIGTGMGAAAVFEYPGK
ncbi:3-ketoacyl-CoA thiolase, peroxisomal isoform X1 [Gopherus evgoodei]|uniref:3-ketoacyl-CoA thiolase, peroxisomal isoform X1 n=1 Tax=Gopherus evgoodei TaxID=1825980 RepID=UPI0011CFFADF|nr:3-ketoacyl-CoA thiolase, peroxisomal isoform X1 [Gopherus evgoodei]